MFAHRQIANRVIDRVSRLKDIAQLTVNVVVAKMVGHVCTSLPYKISPVFSTIPEVEGKQDEIKGGRAQLKGLGPKVEGLFT